MDWEPDEFPVYESVHKRKEKAAKRAKKLAKKQANLEPAVTKGKALATSFWGQAWNRNLERYEHYENRLPRGRSYARNGQVIDLKVQQGEITALVSGTELYEVRIVIKPLTVARWKALKKKCSNQISSLVSLLQGKLPDAVMTAVTTEGSGLFPEPRDIKFICTCPDYSDLCKHSAAAAYGVGARLDETPALLFLLRGVNHEELITLDQIKPSSSKDSEIQTDDLEGIFGIQIDS